MSGISEGDKVSWNYGGGHPSGKVAEIVEGEASVESNRGKEIKKKGTEENPAVVIDQGANTKTGQVVKKASELNETDN